MISSDFFIPPQINDLKKGLERLKEGLQHKKSQKGIVFFFLMLIFVSVLIRGIYISGLKV